VIWFRAMLATVFVLGPSAAGAQPCREQIHGGWTTSLPVDALLRTQIIVTSPDVEQIVVERPSVRFAGKASSDTSKLDGFVYFGQSAYRVTLSKAGNDSWSAMWGPLPTPDGSVPFDLYLGDDGEGGTGGYFFFRDQRMPSLYGSGAQCDGDSIAFSELNLGLTFTGKFNNELTTLTTRATGFGGTSTISWRRMSDERQAEPAGAPILPPRGPNLATFIDRAPVATDDGWPTAQPSEKQVAIAPLDKMIKSIADGKLPLVHSVLVARAGKLIVEEYFYGFDRDAFHDMRSASKSIASTLVGLAVERELIIGAHARALDFLDYESYGNWSESKARITLRHLMTMSSGLDANDADNDSFASENRYQWQSEQPDWIKYALDAPMIAEPGERVIYGSANPMILAGVLESATGGPVEWFADEALFKPLGIDNYRIFMRPEDAGVYLGGGMYLRPRDMLKIGQLYLDGGKWQGKQILSEKWVKESFEKYGRLEPLDRNGNEYGYLWWHENYDVGDEVIASLEARGNGGQYIFVVPELDIAAVITAGNYRGGLEMTRQSQRIFAGYILPALISD